MRTLLANTRLLQRRLPLPRRRFASTNAESVEKTKEALATAQKQAQKVWQSANKFLGPIGDRFGSLLGSYRAPVTYNLTVAKEVLKHIYVAERLQPPSVAEFQTVYLSLVQRLANPANLREVFRNSDLLRVGLYGIEAYGIFKIGEIIGRRSVVGYNTH